MFILPSSIFITSPAQPCKRARILPRIALAFTAFAAAGLFNAAHATYPGENGVIVFSSGTIKRVSPGNSAVTDLTPGFAGLSPRVSPNGKKIVFRSYGTESVYVMNIDGSNRVQLTDFPVRSATWSSDGKLAYTYTVGSRAQLWTMNPNGTGKTFERNLDPGGYQGFDLAWSPSGNIYTFNNSAFAGLSISDAVNPNIRTLDSGGYESSWAPDGASILFKHSNFDQFEINPDGSNSRRVPMDGGTLGVNAISPDGALIAGGLGWRADDQRLVTRARAGAPVTFSWPGLTRDVDWSRVPKNCYETTPQGGGQVLAADVDFYASQCAIAIMPDGGVNGAVLKQVIAIGPDERLYHRALQTNPSGDAPIWSSFAVVPGGGGNPLGIKPKKIAIAASKDGSAQVIIINAADNALYHAMRYADGTWSGFNLLDGAGGALNFAARDVAIAINGSSKTSPGNAQVVANGLGAGDVYHRVRWAAGNWTPFAQITAISPYSWPGAPLRGTYAVAISADERGYTDIVVTCECSSADPNIAANILHINRDVNSNWDSWWYKVQDVSAPISASSDVAVARTLSGAVQLMFTDSSGNAYFQDRPSGNWWGNVTTEKNANTGVRAVSISGATAYSGSQLLLTRAFSQ